MSHGEVYDILMEDVSWKYEEGGKEALKGVDLKVRKGETVVITGPSGAGKTTLCRCINGLIPHFYSGELKGNINVCGMDTRTSTITDISRKVGICFDNPSNQLFCATVFEEVAFGPQNLCATKDELMERVSEALRFCRLEEYKDKNPHALSGGEKQSVAIAASIAMRPEICILDEPTANLDSFGTMLVLDALRKLTGMEKKTTILVEHKLQYTLPIADRLIILDNGEILADGPPKKVLCDAELLQKTQIQVPYVTVLAHKLLKKVSEHNLPITIDEGTKFLKELFNKKKFKPSLAKLNASQSKRQRSPIITCKDVCYKYLDGTVALRGINLEIYEGEFLGLIGKNGSGKTTLAKLFNGLYKPTEGNVVVDTMDTKNTQIEKLASTVGYSFQNPDDQIFAKTVQEELAFGPKNLKLPLEEVQRRVEEVAREVGIYEYLDENPFLLSQGLRQRVAVASVLTMNPKVLVIDEPTTGQDYARCKIIMDLAKRLHDKGKTVIVISHNMDLIAEYCERLVVMLNGQVLAVGPTREIFCQPDLIAKSSLEPPQVTQLSLVLKDYGFPPNVLTINEMSAFLEGEVKDV